MGTRGSREISHLCAVQPARGAYSSFLLKFVLWFVVVSVSLSWMAANIKAEDSVEISSPEESIESSLSGLRLLNPPKLPESSLPTMIPALSADLRTGARDAVSSTFGGLPAGSFAYQVDPISAFLSAAVVLGVQSLREQGRIDMDAIGALLNNTDFYVGVLGSLQAAAAQKGLTKGASYLVGKISPSTIEAIAKNRAASFLTNIVGGLSYTISVGAGFEYFSQFWKLSCQGVEGVSKVSDFVRAPLEQKLAVLNNLYKYFLMGDIQKRIVNSVYNHRILTFEFISMNIAMYLGVVLGAAIAERVGPAIEPGGRRTLARILTDYFARVAGGILFGSVIQFIPDGFRLAVNRYLLHKKLSWAKANLQETLDEVQEGIRMRMYPAHHNRSWESAFSTQESLAADIDKLFRERDLIFSLEAHRLASLPEAGEAAVSMKATQDRIDQQLQLYYRMSGGRNPLRSNSETDAMITQEDIRSADALGLALHRDLFQDEYQKYYAEVLEIAKLRFEQTWKSFEDFFELANHLSLAQAGAGQNE